VANQAPAPAPTLYPVRPGRNRKISDETRAAYRALAATYSTAPVASIADLLAGQSAALAAAADRSHARALSALARAKSLAADLAALS